MTETIEINGAGIVVGLVAPVRLPEKISDLINMAIDDIEAIEKMENYVIDMGTWHETTKFDDGVEKCAVCMAGAVMVNTLKANYDQTIFPLSYAGNDPYTAQRLMALNSFRIGDLEGGWNDIHENEDGDNDCVWPDGLEEDVEVDQYDVNPELFKEQMRNIAKMFADVGE